MGNTCSSTTTSMLDDPHRGNTFPSLWAGSRLTAPHDHAPFSKSDSRRGFLIPSH